MRPRAKENFVSKGKRMRRSKRGATHSLAHQQCQPRKPTLLGKPRCLVGEDAQPEVLEPKQRPKGRSHRRPQITKVLILRGTKNIVRWFEVLQLPA